MIYNYIIPISLYVTVEMQRFISAFFISWDERFFHRADGEEFNAKVNCSDINDELGQINYILSDKTGTLTENEMNFKACSIGATVFYKEEKTLIRADNRQELLPHHDPAVYQFFLALALCHTVQAKREESRSRFGSPDSALLESVAPGESLTMSPSLMEISYTASSPDELALVEAAKSLGVAFVGYSGEGDQNQIQVQTCTKLRSFALEETIEFTSARKRQSVILRDEKG